MLEAGAVGDLLSIKAWKVGEPEPSKPQWTYRDPSPLPSGPLAVVTWHWHFEDTPAGTVDGTYDDIYFHPPVPGDFNSDRVVDVEDIDLLSAEIRLGRYRQQFDLNDDKSVDMTDHGIWVHELKTTWYGDADLNDEFNSNDFVQVFQAGKYETVLGAGWAKETGTPVALSTAATLLLPSRTAATNRDRGRMRRWCRSLQLWY